MKVHLRVKNKDHLRFFKDQLLAEDRFARLYLAPIPVACLGIVLMMAMITAVLCTKIGFNKYTAELLGLWNASGFCVICAAIVGLGFVFRVRFHPIVESVLSALTFVAAPFVAYYMVELFNGKAAFTRDTDIILMNVVAYAVIYLLYLFITGRCRWAIFCGTLACYAFAVATRFVMIFRGTPFVPLDILSTATGINVAQNYVFELHAYWVAATVVAALLMTLGMQLHEPRVQTRKFAIAYRLVPLVLALVLVNSGYSANNINAHSYSINHWEPEKSYEKYGQGMAFALGLRDVYPEKPEGYKASKTDDIIEETLEKTGVDPEGDEAINMLTLKPDYEASGKQPNIIMVMNESLADLQSLGDFSTNLDVLPFINSMKENTIKGYLEVPTFGGGTATTEYEVLTGNAQRFLPLGAVAYSAVIHDNSPSLAWDLRQQGYTTEAFHPYYRNGWSRESAYNYLGFEKYTSLENYFSEDIIKMDAAERMAAVEKTDPEDGNVYIRDYMSDHYDFKLLTQQFEARDKSKPYFMFNVTIQNHGGYYESVENFYQEVFATDLVGYYTGLDRYLSLVHYSDQAFEELITYFEKVEEPTIVVMFGDHLPSVEEGFYKEILGKEKSEYDDMDYFKLYRTPFVVWANYDIPEKNLGTISANYLSTLVSQVAGNELTPYQRYLASLYKEYPVLDSVSIMKRGEEPSKTVEGAGAEDDVLNYQRIAYNNLLDYNNRQWDLFSISGEPKE